jgi:hypothetical protein
LNSPRIAPAFEVTLARTDAPSNVSPADQAITGLPPERTRKYPIRSAVGTPRKPACAWLSSKTPSFVVRLKLEM